MRVLFLTTDTFSSSSGIAKVCRLVCKALNESSKIERIDLLSLIDRTDQMPDPQYLNGKSTYHSFAGNKSAFLLRVQSLLDKQYDVVISSHISLAPILSLLKILSPGSAVVSFAHGIEVWPRLGTVKRIAANHLDEIWAVSAFTRRKMCESNGFDLNKVKVLHNCLDPITDGRQISADSDVHLKRPNLLTVSRLSRHDSYKGHRIVINAVSLLRSQYPNLQYYIVGDGELMVELKALTDRLELNANVHFMGFVEDDRLPDVFSQCDVFVMPSSKEGFGLVFAEAMSYGKPVIAGNKDASSEVVLDGRTGLIVDPDDSEEVAAAIAKLLANEMLREELGTNGKNLVNQQYCFTTFSAKLLNYLKELAGNKHYRSANQ